MAGSTLPGNGPSSPPTRAARFGDNGKSWRILSKADSKVFVKKLRKERRREQGRQQREGS